jgi:hypothetical protein
MSSDLERLRSESGRLPEIAWPGGYSIRYLASDGGTFCAGCANGENGSEARTANGPEDVPDDGWLLVGHYIHWEGAPEECAHCGAELASEYGDPDAEAGSDGR